MSGSHRSAALVSREEGRRRALLLGISALLLLSVAPVFGHHFAVGLEHGLRGKDHLGALCLIALHELLAPVHWGFHALVVAGLLLATADRARAALRTRRTLAALPGEVPSPADALGTAALAVGLDLRRVRVVDGLPTPAFTAGWWRPRVYVSASLPGRLSGDELEALLAHEEAHLARRDPLRLSALRFVALVLFWIPALRRLADDVADEAEVQADDRAARERPLALASALVALAGWGRLDRPPGAGVGFASPAALLERRVRRLAGEEPPPVSHVTRRSLAGALLALVLVWASSAIEVHPMPADHAAHPLDHCGHPGEPSLGHLLCRWDAPPGRLCPHALASR